MGAIKKDVTIGNCRLILGDCMAIGGAVGGGQALVTDPPYGMAYKSSHRKVSHKKIANDTDERALLWACELPAAHSKYVWMRWDNLAQVRRPNSLITWVKNSHSMGDLSHEHGRQTEVCAFYAGSNHCFPKGRPSDVVKAPRTGSEFHPTQKPVGLMMRVVEWTSGVVFDPFMGSGTTLVACAKMGRSGVGIELDPDYFEIACQRVRAAYDQPDLFVEQPRSEPQQEGFDI